MHAPLQSRLRITLCGAAVITITSLYLLFAVRPLYTSLADQSPNSAQPARADAIEPRIDSTNIDIWQTEAAQWSTLAMLGLGLPCAVMLAFGASSTRRRISRLERIAWLLASLLSLALFFATASRTQALFEQLLG
jgi:hypothetical protein